MTPDEKQSLREAALQALAIRHPAALAVPAIARALKREVAFAFDLAALGSALELLRDLGYAQSLNDELGAGVCWSATAKGVLHVERNGGV